jgi:Sulfotransferase family
MREPRLTASAGRAGAGRIVLVGVARSGTSWLGHALGRARGVRFYYEPDNVDADPTADVAAGRRGFGPYPVIDSDRDAGQFAPLWDLVFSGRLPFALRERRRLRPAARIALRLPRSMRDPLVRGAAALSARRPGRAESIVVKTIYATFSLEWLVARYQPKVIAMQRNPLNVVSSWRELQIPLFDLATRPIIRSRYIEPLGIEPPRADASEVARIAWHVGLLTHVIAQAVDRHPEWCFVTHEDLCDDPANTIRSVCEQIGLTWTDDVERFLSENNRAGEGLAPVRIATEEPTRWRKRLNDREVGEIEAVLQDFPTRGWVRPPVTAS